MARGLKFWVWEEDKLYELFSENADQLHGNHGADLRLCFCIMQESSQFIIKIDKTFFVPIFTCYKTVSVFSQASIFFLATSL